VKVCIIGFASAYWRGIPWRDKTWERWGMNGLYRSLPAKWFTRWFELHAKGKSLGQRGWREPEAELRALSEHVTLYLTGRERGIPRGVPYPLADVQALTAHGTYHAGTFDYMVALAILEGASEIMVAGVDFSAGGEPISARPCLEYWLGVAEARGIKVTTVAGDLFRVFRLLRTYEQYGFDAFRLVEDR